jgi:DNA-binding transcriptional ArsR family regulator
MRNQCVTLLRVDAVYAIADPVRREILELLQSGPMSAGAIAAQFTITRPAISRHLRVLREHGLVVDEADDQDGRGRVYRLDARPLRDVDAWLAKFRPGFASALDALETEVHRTRRERRSTSASPNRRRRSA